MPRVSIIEALILHRRLGKRRRRLRRKRLRSMKECGLGSGEGWPIRRRCVRVFRCEDCRRLRGGRNETWPGGAYFRGPGESHIGRALRYKLRRCIDTIGRGVLGTVLDARLLRNPVALHSPTRPGRRWAIGVVVVFGSEVNVVVVVCNKGGLLAYRVGRPWLWRNGSHGGRSCVGACAGGEGKIGHTRSKVHSPIGNSDN